MKKILTTSSVGLAIISALTFSLFSLFSGVVGTILFAVGIVSCISFFTCAFLASGFEKQEYSNNLTCQNFETSDYVSEKANGQNQTRFSQTSAQPTHSKNEEKVK